MPKKEYIGDGVYAEASYGDLWLTTENGMEVTNSICLEPAVLAALLGFIERLKDPVGVGS